MKCSDAGVAMIQQFEGVRLVAYHDSVGIPTIGYGHIRDVKMGDTCSPEQAVAWLREDLGQAEDCVNKAVKVPIEQNQFDALCSFVFNLGCGALNSSTLLHKLNERDYDGAAQEFGHWNHAGGQVVAGLTRRRTAEAERFTEQA